MTLAVQSSEEFLEAAGSGVLGEGSHGTGRLGLHSTLWKTPLLLLLSMCPDIKLVLPLLDLVTVQNGDLYYIEIVLNIASLSKSCF